MYAPCVIQQYLCVLQVCHAQACTLPGMHVEGGTETVIDPFITAVPLWGRTTRNLTGLSAKRDCGSIKVESILLYERSDGSRGECDT